MQFVFILPLADHNQNFENKLELSKVYGTHNSKPHLDTSVEMQLLMSFLFICERSNIIGFLNRGWNLPSSFKSG